MGAGHSVYEVTGVALETFRSQNSKMVGKTAKNRRGVMGFVLSRKICTLPAVISAIILLYWGKLQFTSIVHEKEF